MPMPKKTKRDFRSEEINGWEAAKLLGLSERTFYRAVDDGLIPKAAPGVYRLGDVLAASLGSHYRFRFGTPFWDLRDKLGIE